MAVSVVRHLLRCHQRQSSRHRINDSKTISLDRDEYDVFGDGKAI